MLSAIDVAHYVIARTNKIDHGINNSKLSKVLYFIQAEFLCVFDRPCFADRIEAWKLGVIVPNVYIKFMDHGALQIWYNEKRNPEWLHLDATPDEQYHIDLIIDSLLKYSSGDLIRITMLQDPWKNTYKEGQKRIIPPSLIKEYFQEE